MDKAKEERLEALRSEREKDRVAKNADMNSRIAREKLKMKAGDPVSVTIKSMSFSGYIVAVRIKNGEELFDVDSVNGEILGLKRSQLKWRHVQDMSHIKVPAALKKLNTRHLLSLLAESRMDSRNVAYYNGRNYSYNQIKAELSTREHLPTKKERKAFKK